MIISVAEKELLLFLSDGEQHEDKPVNLSDANFVFAARTLSEKKLVKAAFVEGGDVESIQITKIGMALIDNMQVPNKPVKESNNKSSIISNDELDLLYDKVLQKIGFFRELGYSDTVWDAALPYLERLVTHSKPSLYISRIKNELSIMTEKISMPNYTVKSSSVIAIQLYVILYYLYKDVDSYRDYILPDLNNILGYFNSTRCSFNDILRSLEKLPQYGTSHIEHSNINDDIKIQELESKIIELRQENIKLSEENANLRAEIVTLKSLNVEDPENEQIIIETGQGKTIKKHKTSARKVVHTIIESGKQHVMQHQEWESLLSKITGLNATSFHNFWSTNC